MECCQHRNILWEKIFPTEDNDPSIRKKISKKIEARQRFAASVKTFLLWKLCGDDYRRYDWKDIGSKKSDKWIYDDKDRMEYFLSLPGQKVGCTGARGRCCWLPSRGTSTPGTSRCCSESQRKSKQAFRGSTVIVTRTRFSTERDYKISQWFQIYNISSKS